MVAIGWPERGNLADADSREAIKERYADSYPDRKVERVRVDGGTLHRFVNEISESDRVLTYDKATRTYHIGDVTGEYSSKTRTNIPTILTGGPWIGLAQSAETSLLNPLGARSGVR